MIQFVREVTIVESTYSFDRDDMPTSLLPLYDGEVLIENLTDEQQNDLDDLISNSELRLGDTIGSSGFTVERY